MLGIALGAARAERGGEPLLRGRVVRDWKVAADGTIPDLAGRGVGLTLNGSPTFVAASGSVPAHYTLNGSSQWLHADDHADLDFGPGQDFTIIPVLRIPDTTITANHTYVSKRIGNAAANTGWNILHGSGANQILAGLSDGTTAVNTTATLAGLSNQIITLAFRRSGTALSTFNSTTKATGTDTSNGNLANAEALRVGRLSGAGTNFAIMHFFRLLLVRGALSDAEYTAIMPELIR